MAETGADQEIRTVPLNMTIRSWSERTTTDDMNEGGRYNGAKQEYCQTGSTLQRRKQSDRATFRCYRDTPTKDVQYRRTTATSDNTGERRPEMASLENRLGVGGQQHHGSHLGYDHRHKIGCLSPDLPPICSTFLPFKHGSYSIPPYLYPHDNNSKLLSSSSCPSSSVLLHKFSPSCSVSFWWLMLISMVCAVSLLPDTAHGLHLEGVWHSDSFFLFLAKFGFQKTDPRDLEHTQGIIYGHILPLAGTSKRVHVPPPRLTLVLVDSEYFMEYYENRTTDGKDKCPRMFNKIDTIAFDYKCKPKGPEDFLRKVPCLQNKICVDEDDPKDVIDGYQFTYRIRDSERPRFWYLSVVACHRSYGNHPQQCNWTQTLDDVDIAYDIWMVNGQPSTKHINPFEHQFSFELHDVVEIYVIALIFYCILLSVWLKVCNKLIKHPVTKLLTLNIVLETFGILLNFLHIIKFAFDGVGVKWLSVAGNAIDVLAECLFMLLVLVIAKGWAITCIHLDDKWIVFSVWGLYTVLNAVLFVWNLTEIDIISNTGEWHTGPGYLTLVFRIAIMLWFLYELRRTFLNDPLSKRLLFFQHFGAGILVWFVYLPVLVLVSFQISALWRYKTILSISFAANFLSAVCLVHLLWPSHSVLYLIKQDGLIGSYEMEVTGFLEEHENISVQRLILEDTDEKLSKIKDSTSISTSVPMKNGRVQFEDNELLLD